MYCKNCGKELDGGEYCPNCAAKVNKDSFAGAISRVEKMGKGAKWYLLSLALLIVGAVMINMAMFDVSFKIFETYNLEITVFEGQTVIQVLFVAAYVAAMAIIVIPVLLGKNLKQGYFNAGKWLPIVAMAWVIYVYFNVRNIVLPEEYMELLEMVKLTVKFKANTWLFLGLSFLTCMSNYVAGYECAYETR